MKDTISNQSIKGQKILDGINEVNNSINNEAILCQHCKRTKNNGIRCIGKCVADNDY